MVQTFLQQVFMLVRLGPIYEFATCSLLRSYTFEHILRKANQVPHWLARRALWVATIVFCFDVAQTFVVNLLIEDCT